MLPPLPGQAQRAWRPDGLQGGAVQAGLPLPRFAGEEQGGASLLMMLVLPFLLLPPLAGEGRDGGAREARDGGEVI